MNTGFTGYQREPTIQTAGFRTQQHDSKLKSEEATSQDSLFRSKEKKLDEQFRNLVDQSNRSKEFIDKVYQTTFSTNKPLNGVASPSENPLSSGLLRSPTGNHHPHFENNYDYSQRLHSDNVRLSDYDTNKPQDDYNTKLEHEIQDLKNTVLERLRYQESQVKSKAPSHTKSSNKQKIETSSSSEDDDDEPEQDLISDYKKKAGAKSHLGTGAKGSVRSYKSPDYKLKKKGLPRQTEDEYRQHILESRAKSTAKNVTALKNKYDEREAALKDKYLNLKFKAKEMRSTLQEYVDKCVDLEENVQKRDRTLLDYEDQVKQSQQELLRNFEILQEAKRNEDAILKSEEDLRIQNGDFKSRVQEYKKRVDDLEEQTRRNEIKYQTQLEDLQNERQELKIGLRDRDDKIELVATANDKFKNEIDRLQKEIDKRDNMLTKQGDHLEKKDLLFSELKEKFDGLQIEAKGLHAKNEEYKEIKISQEEKIARYKKKLDEDRVKWEADKGRDFGRKKDKIKKLKGDIKELEGHILKLNDDKKGLAIEIEKILAQKVHQEKDLTKSREESMLAQQEMKMLRGSMETLKSQCDEAVRSNQKDADRAVSLQAENKKLHKAVKALEERISNTEREFFKSDELNSRFRSELKAALEDNEKAKEYIVQLEAKFTYVGTRQDDELTKFETKISHLERELLIIKDENNVLKSSQANNTKEFETTRDERDHFKRDYKALKQINKNLEKDLREMDERVREFIHEKQLELRDHNKDMTMQKQHSTKLKALEEIQGMIRNHRQSHKNKFDYTE